jgi:hypothetical protein
MSLQRIDRILAARGMEAAMPLKKLAQRQAVKANELNQQPGHN